MAIVAAMFAVGLLLGFIGAGGSGFIIAILTVVFGYPLHTALGTALSAMAFSSLAGAVSHYRDGNVAVKIGAVVGISGAAAAVVAAQYTVAIPAGTLRVLTASLLIASGLALWLRMAMTSRGQGEQARRRSGAAFWLVAGAVGMITGALSGMFGIGSTPFIQIGLMALLGLSPRVAAGTTMMIILPIAIGGGAGFWHVGHLELPLLAKVVAGTMLGTYIGAKFTRRVPARWLKAGMVTVPMIGGVILLV